MSEPDRGPGTAAARDGPLCGPKVRVFIGSSSEAIALMSTVAEWLREVGVVPLAWNDTNVFPLGRVIADQLAEHAEDADGAILLFTADDECSYRGTRVFRPRDNVLIEFGAFMARLGRERAVVCRSGNPHIAVDLGGVLLADIAADDDTAAKIAVQHWAAALTPRIVETYTVQSGDIAVLIDLWRSNGSSDSVIVKRLLGLNVPDTIIGEALR